MSFDVYKTATSLRDRATMVGLDIDALEFALYALGVIGDGGAGVWPFGSSVASTIRRIG